MVDMDVNVNVRVVYESTPIRHIAVQCPACGKWFEGNDITKDSLSYEHQINFAEFVCPVCGKTFGNYNKDWLDFDNYNMNIKEVDSGEECYEGCLRKKEVWE